MSGEFVINYFLGFFWPLGTDQVFLTSGRCMALGPKKMDDCRATFNGTNGTWLVVVPSMLFFPLVSLTPMWWQWQLADDNHRMESDGQIQLWWWAVGPTVHIRIFRPLPCRLPSCIRGLEHNAAACWATNPTGQLTIWFKSIPSQNITAGAWATVGNISHMASKVKT